MSDKLPTKPVLLGNSLKNDLLGSIMACQNSLLMFAFIGGIEIRVSIPHCTYFVIVTKNIHNHTAVEYGIEVSTKEIYI